MADERTRRSAPEVAREEIDAVADRMNDELDEIDEAPVDKFNRVFVLILITIIATAMLTQSAVSMLLLLLVQSLTVFTALRTSHASPRTLLFTLLALVSAILAVSVGLLLTDPKYAKGAYGLVMLILVAVVPIAIARRLLQSKSVTIQTVWGALSIYLLIGLFFSTVYQALEALSNKPFFGELTGNAPPYDFVYFSYTTMTTVGYGDLTAANPLGKMLSVTEALMGQIFLVTIIALLVSRLQPGQGQRVRNQRRHSRGRLGSRREEDPTASATPPEDSKPLGEETS